MVRGGRPAAWPRPAIDATIATTRMSSDCRGEACLALRRRPYSVARAAEAGEEVPAVRELPVAEARARGRRRSPTTRRGGRGTPRRSRPRSTRGTDTRGSRGRAGSGRTSTPTRRRSAGGSPKEPRRPHTTRPEPARSGGGRGSPRSPSIRAPTETGSCRGARARRPRAPTRPPSAAACRPMCVRLRLVEGHVLHGLVQGHRLAPAEADALPAVSPSSQYSGAVTSSRSRHSQPSELQCFCER